MMVDGTDDGADGSGRPSSAVLRPELPSSPSAPVSFVVPRRRRPTSSTSTAFSPVVVVVTHRYA